MMPTPVEALVVYAVVALCAAYCVWVFMPAGIKRRAATALLRRIPRLGSSRKLQAMTKEPGGCGSGCGNCGSAAGATRPPTREHKVHWIPCNVRIP